MSKELKDWDELRQTLTIIADDKLGVLLDSCEILFNGEYQINANHREYAGLREYYPFLEMIINEKTGKHLRLYLNPNSVPMGTDGAEDLEFNLELGASNISEAIMRPESIAAVPSYLLRFVPFVGSGPVFIATALRQAFYRASRDSGADQLYPKLGDSVKIDVRALLNTLGGAMSRASYFRIFKDGSMDWFVQRGKPSHRVEDGQVRREANTYHYRGILLTPGDACDLYHYLINQKLSEDPINVLSKLLDTPRDLILQFPFRLPKPEDRKVFHQAVSVHEVILKAHGTKTLDPTLAGLGDRIANHLVRPESFLAVPWYWFRKVLPDLGLDLGMLYLMCKNCCYVDWAHGKDRNSFWVPGGLDSLKAWTGNEALPLRIPHAEPSQRGRPRLEEINPDSAYTRNWRDSKRRLAGQYLLRVDTRQSETGSDWKLEVNDVQLTAKDESLKQAIYNFIYSPPFEVSLLPMQDLLQKTSFQQALLANAKANPKRLCHFETLKNAGICQSETYDKSLISHFDTLVDALNNYFETLIAADICHFETVLNILFKLKYTSFFKPNTFNQPHTPDFAPQDLEEDILDETESSEVADYLKEFDWDFNNLFSIMDIRYQLQIRGLELERATIAWVIYACFNLSINNPWSLAIRRVLDMRKGPGGAAERFAQLPASRVQYFVESTYHRMQAGYFNALHLNSTGGQDLLDLIINIDNIEDQKRALRRVMDAFRFDIDEN